MTVSATPGSTAQLAGNGSTNTWPFAFNVGSAADVKVTRVSEGGGATVIDPSLYTVALTNGGGNGGTVTYPTGAARVPAGEFIIVSLDPDFTQPSSFTNEGHYSPARNEAAFDHLARQIKSLKVEASGGVVHQPPGVTIEFGPPIDGAHLVWRLLSSGVWQIHSGADDETGTGTPPGLRILYASDLGLRGDGTDETAEINAQLLTLSQIGKPVIVYLQSAAGYWPISAQLKNRSGISLSWGSPLRFTKEGSIGFVGNVAREPTVATVSSFTATGATVIPVSTVGGGAVSGVLAVDDQIELGSGSMRVRITDVDDDALTITIATTTTQDLSAGSTVRRHIFSYTTQSWAQHDTPQEIGVADNSLFPINSVVWITDDEMTTHVDGAQTVSLNHEFATVLGYGTGTIQLNRSIRHWMSTANRARVFLIDPCQYATISGASVVFTEAPDADQVDTFQCSFAYRCQLLNCAVPNDDDFGSRGRAFNLDRCYETNILDSFSGFPKYAGAGEGYGVAFVKCTECGVYRFHGVGSRHVVSFIGSTDCVGQSISGNAWQANMIDFHGQREIGCWVYEVQGVGTSRTAVAGVSFGNPSWRGGCFECGVESGEITDLQGAGSRGLVAWGIMDDCDLKGVVFRRVTRGIDLRDQEGAPTLHIGTLRIACDFHRADEAGLVQMELLGSTDRPLTRLDLSGSRWFDWVTGLYINNCDDVVLHPVHMQTFRAQASGYAVDLRECTGAIVSGYYQGCQKHFRFADTQARLQNYTVRDPGTTSLVDEMSASPVSGGVRDAYGTYPAGWTPVRVSAQTTLTVLSLPGMT